MVSRDYRSTARAALRGYWGTSILVALVAGLLGATGNSFAAGAGSGSSNNDSTAALFSSLPPSVLGVIMAIITFLAVYSLVTLIIGGAVRLGLVSYNMNLITRRNPPAFGVLFSRFNIFGKAFALQFMTNLFISLWMLTGLVPGIILVVIVATASQASVQMVIPLVAVFIVIPAVMAQYRYALAPYLMAENQNIGVMEALKLSKQMMVGNKWRMFKLDFSFIGWGFLNILTLGIGSLWLIPYIYAAEAAFCLDVMRNNAQGGSQPQAAPAPEM